MHITSRLSQTLDIIHTSFPRALASSLPQFMTASLNHLRVLYPTFSHYYLSATEAVPSTSEDESIELPQLLCPIIDFLSAVTRGGKCRQWLGEENILSLVASIFNYVQMTDDDVNSSPLLRGRQFFTLLPGTHMGAQRQCFRCAGRRRNTTVQCKSGWIRSPRRTSGCSSPLLFLIKFTSHCLREFQLKRRNPSRQPSNK